MEIFRFPSFPFISCRSPFGWFRSGGLWRVLYARLLGVFRGFRLRFWGIGDHGASVAWLGLGCLGTYVLICLGFMVQGGGGFGKGVSEL